MKLIAESGSTRTEWALVEYIIMEPDAPLMKKRIYWVHP